MIFENNQSMRNALLGSVSASALIAAYSLPPSSASAAEIDGTAITAADQTAGLTEATAGTTSVVVNTAIAITTIGSNTAASIAVTGGAQLTVNITSSGTANGVIFDGNITTGTATDTLTINSTTADALVFRGSITEGGNANAIVINVGSAIADAVNVLTFDHTVDEDNTIDAAILAVDADDTVNIIIQSTQTTDGHTLTFSDAIGGTVAANAVDSILVDSNVSNSEQTAVFSSTVNTGTLSVTGDGNASKNAAATVTGNLTASGAVTLTGAVTGLATLNLGGAIISAGSFVLNKITGQATLNFVGAANQSVTGIINGSGNTEGVVNIEGNSVVFNSIIGATGTPEDINIGLTSVATQAVFRANVSAADISVGNTGAVNAQMIVQTFNDGTDITITGPIDPLDNASNAALIVVDTSSATADTVTFANTVGAAKSFDLLAVGSSTLGGNAIFSNTVGNTNAVALIQITGGDAAAEDSSITFSGADVTATAMTLNDNTGDTTVTFNGATMAVIGTIDGAAAGEGTVVINTAGAGTFNSVIGGIQAVGDLNIGTANGADATVTFNAASVAATNITLGNAGASADTVTVSVLAGGADLTIAGEINAIAGETGVNKLHIDDITAITAPNTVAFTGNVGATVTLDILNVGTASNTAGAATFAGTVNAAAITLTAGNQTNEVATASFAGSVNATTIALVGAAGNATGTFAGNLTTSGAMTLTTNTGVGTINLTGSAQTVSGVMEGASGGDGALNISGTAVSISSNIGGTNRLGAIDITNTGNVTVTSAMVMDATLVKLSGGTLNLNATLTTNDGATVWNLGGASGGTIVIGRPVASYTNSVVIDASADTVTLDAGNAVAVTPHVGFTSGTLTLVKGNTATKNALTAGDFTANNTALTQYAFTKSGSDIVITATAKSAAATAAEIGVSTQVAAALSSAVAATVGDATVTAAFQSALSAGGAVAQNAAKQTQNDPGALSAASAAASGSGAASFSAVGTRLASLRQKNHSVAYASGDAALGFAAGSGALKESVWLKPFGSVATQELRDGIDGFGVSTRGVAFGFDMEVDDNSRVGLFGSFAQSTVEGDGVQDAKTDITSQQVGVYGDYTTKEYYLEGMLSYGRNDTSQDRLIDFGGLNLRARGDFTSNQYQARAAGGIPVETGGWYFTPNASLSYTQVKGEAFTEAGAGVLNLTVNQDDVRVVMGQVGMKIHTDIKQDGGTLTPELRANAMHDFEGQEATSSSNFANGAGTAFTVTGAEVAQTAGSIGVGLTYAEGNMSVGVSYDYVGKSDYQGHNGTLTARWKF